MREEEARGRWRGAAAAAAGAGGGVGGGAGGGRGRGRGREYRDSLEVDLVLDLESPRVVLISEEVGGADVTGEAVGDAVEADGLLGGWKGNEQSLLPGTTPPSRSWRKMRRGKVREKEREKRAEEEEEESRSRSRGGEERRGEERSRRGRQGG